MRHKWNNNICENCGAIRVRETFKRKMPPDQRREMKRAFFGAWGQALIHFRDEIAAETENKAVQIMESQLNEVIDFWMSEAEHQN